MDGVFAKFGKEKHLKQIIEGKIRFAPSADYIKIERDLHDKGQGDLLEGKWVIHTEFLKMEPYNLSVPPSFSRNTTVVVRIQDVDTMPTFCLTHYRSDHIENNELTISVKEYETIRRDFPKATHVLLILEPDVFVEEVEKADNHKMVSSDIHYYDYDINDINMLSFLTTGDENGYKEKGIILSMEYDNRYRHLFCKDKFFAEQSEYRFIVLDELINNAKFYKFNFRSLFMLLPIEDMKKT